MLKSLSIENYALIDSLEIDFYSGFSAVTGETGAGKSVIIGALSLILGQRAEAKHIRQNEQKCTIEGVFDIARYNLQPLFSEKDWEYDSGECIIRREIWTNGKSRAFVNDSPVYLNDLKELGDKLIDIHSQHQNLSLNDNRFQLDTLDILAKTKEEKERYQSCFRDCLKTQKQLSELKEEARKSKEEEEYLQFQFSSLAEARLQEDEQELLESELETITHAEEIKSSFFEATQIFSGDETGMESRLKRIYDILSGIQNYFPRAQELAQRVETSLIDLKDVNEEAEKYFETIDYDAKRQQFIEERLNLIYDLQKKHSVKTLPELLDIEKELDERLQKISSSDEQIELLEKELLQKRQIVREAAEKLSDKRKKAIPGMESELSAMLRELGMPNAKFSCAISSKPQEDIEGFDSVNFLFSANKNVALQPVSQIASGGEISRLMLCLKSMIAGATALPTIIFDEIDTGTSGEIADKMGQIMREMGNDMQVIAISHLPQIASKGDAHYIVYKDDKQDVTQTYMRQLSEDERVEEIARMLSGAEVSAQAVANAKVMLNVQHATK